MDGAPWLGWAGLDWAGQVRGGAAQSIHDPSRRLCMGWEPEVSGRERRGAGAPGAQLADNARLFVGHLHGVAGWRGKSLSLSWANGRMGPSDSCRLPTSSARVALRGPSDQRRTTIALTAVGAEAVQACARRATAWWSCDTCKYKSKVDGTSAAFVQRCIWTCVFALPPSFPLAPSPRVLGEGGRPRGGGVTRRRGGNWKPTRPERLASGARRGRVVTIKLLGSGGNRQRLSKRRQLTLLVVGGRLCGGGGSRLRW